MLQGVVTTAIVAIAMSSHAAESTAPAAAASPAPAIDPVFDCYHTNSAWGFTLSGKSIDSLGRVWSYGRHGQAWQPAPVKDGGALYLTAEDLQQKFSAPKQVGSVDTKDLAENSHLIANAAEGTITRADTGVRDAGTSACHAYVHDQTHQRYRDVDLGSDDSVSDMRNINSAPEARTLLTWLKSVGVAK
jgi:hypothetical protein